MAYLDDRARGIGYQSYSHYLSSNHWKHMVETYRTSTCFCCRAEGTLHLHHLSYERLGAEQPTDFVTVCNSCHDNLHTAVNAGKVSLGNAHLRLAQMIGRYGKKAAGTARPIDWVTNWRQLVNRSKKDTVTDVENFLSRKGLLTRDCGPPCATLKAVELGFAKESDDGRFFWDRRRYLGLVKASRSYDRCIAKGTRPGTAVSRYALEDGGGQYRSRNQAATPSPPPTPPTGS